jgi:hypothetical protein
MRKLRASAVKIHNRQLGLNINLAVSAGAFLFPFKFDKIIVSTINENFIYPTTNEYQTNHGARGATAQLEKH